MGANLEPAEPAERGAVRRGALLALVSGIVLYLAQPLPYAAFHVIKAALFSRPINPDPYGAIGALNPYGSWEWITGVVLFTAVVFLAAALARQVSAGMDLMFMFLALVAYLTPFAISVLIDPSAVTVGVGSAIGAVAFCFVFWLNGWVALIVAGLAILIARRAREP